MSAIQLQPRMFPLAFILLLFPPKVSIDGQPEVQVKWGTPVTIPVAPGRHSVRVWFSYLFMKRCNEAELVLDVGAGQTIPVVYKSRWLVFLPGKIAVEGPPAVAAAAEPQEVGAGPAAWHPDPTGRNEQRYYDGRAWTANVSNGGVQTTDPI